eukprot:scaffold1424_cov237-Pinguiococcus_pyrenoidosus.AAC.2
MSGAPPSRRSAEAGASAWRAQPLGARVAAAADPSWSGPHSPGSAEPAEAPRSGTSPRRAATPPVAAEMPCLGGARSPPSHRLGADHSAGGSAAAPAAAHSRCPAARRAASPPASLRLLQHFPEARHLRFGLPASPVRPGRPIGVRLGARLRQWRRMHISSLQAADLALVLPLQALDLLRIVLADALQLLLQLVCSRHALWGPTALVAGGGLRRVDAR